jgi:hypothetical protein
MNKLITLFSSLIILLFSTLYAFAEFAVGITGTAGLYRAHGEEVENSEKTDDVEDLQVGWASIFAEYEFDILGGLRVGVDYVPETVETGTSTRVDSSSNDDSFVDNNDANATTNDLGTSSVKAEFSGLITYYAEMPIVGGMYIKGGISEVDVATKETLHTGSSYGDKTISGHIYGIGYKTDVGSFFLKAETIYQEFEHLALTSESNADNKVTADVAGLSGKISIGKSF